MSSAVESFFDITTGRNHGVVPTADSLRIILDSGASLILEKDGGTIRATAGSTKAGEYRAPVEATGERIDQALSALVGKLVLGESGVEVTEWEVEAPKDSVQVGQTTVPLLQGVRFGQTTVPLLPGNLTHGQAGEPLSPPVVAEDDIVQRLIGTIELARREWGRGGRINAVVVRVSGYRNLVGVACLSERPEPPIGAKLVARRRLVGGTPCVELPLSLDTFSGVQWDKAPPGSCPTDAGAECLQISGPRRLRQAAAAIKQDCALAGLAPGSTRIRVCLLSAGGQELGCAELGLEEAFYGYANTISALLEKTVTRLAKVRAGKGCEDVTLRMTVVPDGAPTAGAVSRRGVRDSEDASR